MMPPLHIPPLGISEKEARTRFAALQRKLVPLWEHIRRFNDSEQTIVVVPSMTIEFDLTGVEMQAYEERMLFMLLLLRQPRARLVYATSQTILPSTLDYYLSILPGVVTSHAAQRFFNIALEDRSPRPLTVKLLERPHVCERIRSLILDSDRAHLVAYNETMYERDLALRLGIPIYGADPELAALGTKSGGREVFASTGVSHAIGRENLRSLDELLNALREMRDKKSDMTRAIVKLNDSTSGAGGAVIELPESHTIGTSGATTLLEQRVRSMTFESSSMVFERFFDSLAEHGGIVEEYIQGIGFSSPSVQMRITPLGEVEILSTHDQMLGGPTGQSFLGSRFPANRSYGPLITAEARKVGHRLAELGVLGRFAIDFVVVQDDVGRWQTYAIEINLRKGGTTHPYLFLQFLTDGEFSEEEGVFRAPSGVEKYYVASDHLEDTLYHAITPQHLIDILIRHRLHFDQAKQTGIVVHMLAMISENGRFGVVAIDDSPARAEDLYSRMQTIVRNEALQAIRAPAIPEPR
ncbi:MAG: peptide ligase PGM1-related protein [Gammaproteobacteria bacterium]